MHAAIMCAVLSLLIGSTGYGTDACNEGVAFSQLPLAKQRLIMDRIAPPPIAQRDAPYSTTMVYLLAKGYQDGYGSQETGSAKTAQFVLDRNRPDWQEVIIKDWAELGLTSTVFYTWPSHWDDPETIQAIEDYVSQSEKYGLKVGFWLGAFVQLGGPGQKGGTLHPDHPQNQLGAYLEWVKIVAQFGKGRVDQYIIGDELNSSGREKYWMPEKYMQVFVPISKAIKSVDAGAQVCMYAMGGLDWDYVQAILKLGYARHGDGVAANFRDYPPEVLHDFVDKVKKIRPDFGLWSNGLHWVGCRDTTYYASDRSPVWVFADNEGQAVLMAQRMFKLFDANWDRAPYYISIRQWVLGDDTQVPHWYGFFGFADLIVDKYDNLTVKHYPGWYAYQTIAQIFYSQSKTHPAPFEMGLSEPVDFDRIYVRDNYECLIVLWNKPAMKVTAQEYLNDQPSRPPETVPDLDRPGKVTTTSITLPTQRYAYPVHIFLFNYQKLTDLPYRLADDKLVIPDVTVGTAPVIIRLVAEKQK